ncbi:hypothetical protein SAMN05444395_105166 [Flavobacterium fryxellicola]|uniref:Prenyltransferase n=1 Tax=Flavobacterium fryxellicola TaxID=249352 RepID=A0A167WRX1_9FLAO|nr:hypothetical protein [Flavobacterium fryxellicola]OAB27684.1 hypothetical protein FBFR_10955 [Flavobacterium fryxellicola]SHN70129.1 hypothetical protein SAMN05444395_105166 [Flavobacterium fryxellicola]
MRVFKLIVDFYIKGSIHVGLSCYALVRMTQHMFHISYEDSLAHFAFFGTIVGYNFVKYDALARAKKIQMRKELKAIAVFSFCCFILVGYYFFQLQRVTQIVAVAFLSITLLYTLPFFPNKRNARNWAGVKIYIVALCWVGVTLGLPVLNAEIPIIADFYLKCLQRFLLVFVLVLVFEIIDLANDDPHLKTVPQQIGVRRTKLLGLLLLLPFYLLEFLKSNFDESQLVVNLLLVIMISLFLLFANEKRSKYYTSFWVESIPLVWWLLLLII